MLHICCPNIKQQRDWKLEEDIRFLFQGFSKKSQRAETKNGSDIIQNKNGPRPKPGNKIRPIFRLMRIRCRLPEFDQGLLRYQRGCWI